MQPVKVKIHAGRTGRSLLAFALVLTMTAAASVAGAFSLPTDRSITWQGNAGVLNDIPVRTTIYTTLSPSGGDDTSAIQTALTNCPSGQVVKLNSGTFTVSKAITLKSGVTLRGAGINATTLQGVSGMTGNYFIGMNAGVSLGTSFNIVGGLSKGSTSITTSSAHGWSAGDLILIDQMNSSSTDPVVSNVGNNGTCTWCGRSSGGRSMGQVAKVTAVPSSTTATLEIPLYINYNSSLSPQATKITGVTKDAGIENLTVDNSASGNSNQQTLGTIAFRGTSNCWLSSVGGKGSYGKMVEMWGAYRCTIRKANFRDGVPATPTNGSQYATDRAYGVNFDSYNSANLIEDCQLYHLRLPVALVGASSGNVIAYNYITDLYSDTTAGTFQLTAITTHGAHPMMNLMEGNYVQGRLRADDVWGSSSHNTYFRNREALQPDRADGRWDTDMQKDQTYYNLVGNVLGTLGTETVYLANAINLTGSAVTHRFGYTGDGDTSGSGNDSVPYSSVILHGNWDAATNGVNWNSSYDRTLPTSMYMSSKPAWWGGMQFPPIGPDVSPMYPAAITNGNGTPWDGQATVSSPTNLVAQ